MQQREVWEKIAEPWQKFRTQLPPTVEKFLAGKKGKILDVGCGSGRNFLAIDGLEWTGVDFSEKMIDFSRVEAERKRIDVNLKVACAEDLPFDDESFDAVLFYATIHCIDSAEKRRRSLEEIYRVLKKGGEALISGWGFNSPRLKNKEKECYVPWGVREGEGKVDRYTYIFELDELAKLCESVGFEVLQKFEERNVNVVVKKK
jgi:ubiquinone/menaquinone biosynthesis C-methylase UbiE